jgi:integrase
MANISPTTITKTTALNFVKTAKLDAELACEKIQGFHLRKTQKGGTWRLRYTDFAGKRRKASLGKFVDGSKDRIDAAELAIDYWSKLNRGTDPLQEIEAKKEEFRVNEQTKGTRTIGTYLDGPYTLHQSRKTNGGKHTLDMIRRSFAEYLDRSMDEMNKAIIHQWQSDYTNSRIDKKTGEIKPRSHDTVSRSYSALKTMIKHAYQNDVITSFPLAEVSLMDMSDKEKEALHNKADTKRRLLTKKEIKQLNEGLALYRNQLIDGRENSRKHGKPHLQSFKDLAYPNWFFPFFRLAAYTGMRPGDLYSLQWHQLNLDFKRLVKVPNKTRHHKNPAKLDIPLNDDIVNVMRLWFEQLGKPSPEQLVFPSPVTGEQLSRDAHEKPWAQVLKLGEVGTTLDFYALRHHYISRLVSNGTPLFTVARLAGHKSTKMIEEHYGHLSPHHAAAALEAISGDFAQGSKAI